MDNITQHIIRLNEYQYEYFVSGSSDKVLIAFNGFGKGAEEVFFFNDAFKKHKVISINLLYHGNSFPISKKKEAINDEHLRCLMLSITEKEKFKEFSLFGYSLGGKIALKIVELFPQNIDKIILLAPDGIKLNTWYNLATKNILCKAIFRFVIKKPAILFFTSTLLVKLGIIKKSTDKFMRLQMDSLQKRKMVYNVWMVYPYIIPHLLEIKKLIQQYGINCLLIYGKYDSIIPAKIAHRFTRNCEKFISLKVLELGHNLFHEKTKKHLTLFLKQKKEA